MNEHQAASIAEALAGKAIQGDDKEGGEPNWLVVLERSDGRVVLISERAVEEFPDLRHVVEGRGARSISLV